MCRSQDIVRITKYWDGPHSQAPWPGAPLCHYKSFFSKEFDAIHLDASAAGPVV
jgi:hypothetical protein